MPEHKNNVLVLERVVNAKSDLVWKTFTDITLLKQWMPFFREFEPRVGFETRFMLGKDSNHEYEHICIVIEVIPHKKLTYTWYYEGYSGKSNVSYELFPQGQKTKVVLTHTIAEAFPNTPHFAKKNFVKGWTYMIDALQKFVEGVKENV